MDNTLIEDKIFPCSQCGECCKHIAGIPELEKYDNGSGMCIHLVNNLCSIYKERPQVCRGNYIYDTYFKGMPVKDFYEEMKKICSLISEGEF